MINISIIFIISYLTTILGFSLGKSTKDEHKEVKVHALKIAYLFQAISILFLIYNNKSEILFWIISILPILIIALAYYQNHQFLEFNGLYLFTLSFHTLFNKEVFYITILPLLSLILINSFKKKVSYKEEAIKIIILSILYLMFM